MSALSARYVLYVHTEGDAKDIQQLLRGQVFVQPLKNLSEVPRWLSQLPAPVLVDRKTFTAAYGDEMRGLAAEGLQKQTQSKMGFVEDDE